MASAIKWLVFKGVENEDPDYFWFVIRVVWEAQGVTDDIVASLTLHLRNILSQQRLTTQVDALAIAMRLHET